jgi:hypothetical protein
VVAGVTAGNGLSGRISPNGSVRATGYMGSNYGIASGRLSGNSGGEPGARVWETVAAPVFGPRSGK